MQHTDGRYAGPPISAPVAGGENMTTSLEGVKRSRPPAETGEASVTDRVLVAAGNHVCLYRPGAGYCHGPDGLQLLHLGLLGLVLGPIALLLALSSVRNGRPSWSRLLAGGDPGSGPVDVLIGIDGSRESATAVSAALDLLGDRMGRLALVAVTAIDQSPAGREEQARLQAELERQAQALRLAQRGRRQSGQAGQTVIPALMLRSWAMVAHGHDRTHRPGLWRAVGAVRATMPVPSGLFAADAPMNLALSTTTPPTVPWPGSGVGGASWWAASST
jgi:hypothetical protein